MTEEVKLVGLDEDLPDWANDDEETADKPGPTDEDDDDDSA